MAIEQSTRKCHLQHVLFLYKPVDDTRIISHQTADTVKFKLKHAI